ncbi:MAG: Xaa-Pro peptidase family protein [Candidatus Andersenbacteria bacterium]
MKSAYLLFDAKGPEIRHRSGVVAPDSFIYLAPEGKPATVYFDAREYGVQKQKLEALGSPVRIERLEPYAKKAKKATGSPLLASLLVILKEHKINAVRISPAMPYAIAKALEKAGKKIIVHSYEGERECKTEAEIKFMIAAQRVTEATFELARQILVASTVKRDRIIYKKNVLTSEYMKARLQTFLLEKGYSCPEGMIVASGEQTSRPHDEGEGPLLPNQCIIIDIFPQSQKTGFFADMTRTFVKGKASKDIRTLFRDVADVQRQILESVNIGQQCTDVYKKTVRAFKKLGHPTLPEKGFMHGTGHGLGLSVHEGSSLNAYSERRIEPGMVLTVEPGLYYPGIGGVRFEDVVIFHPDSRKQNITQFTKPYVIS